MGEYNVTVRRQSRRTKGEMRGSSMTVYPDKLFPCPTNEDIVDKDALDPLQAIIRKRTLNQVLAQLDMLPHRDKEIVKDRFGLDGRSSCTYREIGLKYRVTPERIRQILYRAIRNIHHRVAYNLRPMIDSVAEAVQ